MRTNISKKQSGFLFNQVVIKNVFILLSVLLILTGCKKNKSDQPNGNGNNPTSAKRLLKITKTQGAQTTIFNFSYETSGRLTAMTSNNGTEDIHITYDASGNPATLEEANLQFANLFTYTYNNGAPVSATFKSYQKSNGTLIEDDVYTYTVSNGKVSNIHLNMLKGPAVADFTITYNGDGNVTKIEAPGFITATYTYGNKKPVYPISYKYITDLGFAPRFSAQNEMLTEVYDVPGTANDRTTNMQYTYDTRGYPLTSTDGTAQYTYEYQ
jgi:hypothetical protein